MYAIYPAIGTGSFFQFIFCRIRIMHEAMDISSGCVMYNSCYMCAQDRIHKRVYINVCVRVVDWRYNNGDSI